MLTLLGKSGPLITTWEYSALANTFVLLDYDNSGVADRGVFILAT